MYESRPLTDTLPRYLCLDNDESDFTAILDTRDGVIWSVDETNTQLTAILEWRMHPAMQPQIDFPRSTREVTAWWKDFNKQQTVLMEEDDGY